MVLRAFGVRRFVAAFDLGLRLRRHSKNIAAILRNGVIAIAALLMLHASEGISQVIFNLAPVAAPVQPELNSTTGSGAGKEMGASVLGGPGASAALHLSNGDFLAGELLDCDDSGNLSWQGIAFDAPLEFPLSAVSAVAFESHGPRPRPNGPYCLELEGGDVLFGNLVGLSNEQVQFDSPGLGMLHVKRSAIQRLVHSRGGADLIYLGPNGLLEWKASPAGAWEQDAGRLFTAQDEAIIDGEFGLPKQACIEFELSWTSDPDFTLCFGTPAGLPRKESVFRTNIWDSQLILLGEVAKKADFVSLQKIAPGAGRCHFRVYLDQEHLRAIVLGADGHQVADLTLGGAQAKPKSLLSGIAKALSEPANADAKVSPGDCMRLVNHHGNVRLEQLSIARWNGQPPPASRDGKSQLDRADGSIVNGEIEKFDAATQEFIIADGDRKLRVKADAVDAIVLPSSGQLSSSKQSSGNASINGLRAICDNGIRLSGKLRKVENGRMWLKHPGIIEPIGIDLSSLRSLVVLQDAKPLSEPKGRRGLLQSDGVKLHGCLEESSQSSTASCLVWQPCGSLAGSSLKQDFTGRIVYHEPPPPQPSVQTNTIGRNNMVVMRAAPARVGVLGAVMNVFGGETTVDTSPKKSPQEPTIHLRTGDTIPCKVNQIDERGITFHSSQFDATFVPHEKVKAIELENRSVGTKIDLPKRDRLLTLPRSQRDDQPTHLIRSTDGDYLRGRLMEMDDKTLTVEVRMETRHVPRDHVASIIWLDKVAVKSPDKDKPAPDKQSPDKVKPATADGKPATPKQEPAKPATAPKTLPANRVQSLGSNGVRLTFQVEKMTGTTLQGKSDVLGACRVELGAIDKLLLGQAIEQEAQTLPYQRWALQPAVEPKFTEANGGAKGVESELVGKLALDFELETLDGPKFHLRDQRKKIVVLDFWASWCGPCMQTLPLLVPTVDKFRDRNVILLAVNLQDTPEVVKATLTRLNLKMPVGLDRDGLVAEKYAAAAIPQTVIIDTDGKVARLFVGGGPQYVEELTEALEAVVKAGTEKAKSP